MSKPSPADDWEIDMEKLAKLEKMIVRVDADIQRMHKENDKLLVVETLKKVITQKDEIIMRTIKANHPFHNYILRLDS